MRKNGLRRFATAGLLLVLAGQGGAALAADKLAFGPPAGWVDKSVAPVAGDDGVIARLGDVQTRFEADGRSSSYMHAVTRMLSPEIVKNAGTVGMDWQPATDEVTFHSVIIRRGDQRIDVLGNGERFEILRRESKLESAMIDGRLTAVLNVPDLRVGDELEVAFTLSQYNPVLKGQVEYLYLMAPNLNAGRLRFSQNWPAALPMRYRAGEALPKFTVTRNGDRMQLLADSAPFRTLSLPDGAPNRYADLLALQYSTFADWQAVSRLMASLYAEAATLPADSPLRQEIARIAAASPDPHARATAALRLVQRDIRYLANVSGLGGYVPATADKVWAERQGDCKGKTALLLALLQGLGIDARPALVSAGRSDGVDKFLPMPARFDHVIVEARIDGKSYWLDGTRPADGDIRSIPVPEFRWALPLTAAGEPLAELKLTPFTEPQSILRLDLDARAGLSAPAKATGRMIQRGDGGQQLAATLQSMDPENRDRALRGFWSQRHDWVEIDKVEWSVDPADGHVEVGFTGTGKIDWEENAEGSTPRAEANKARLGVNISPKRRDTLAPDAPVLIDRRYESVRQTILLPDGGKGFSLDGGEPIDVTYGGIRYTRKASLANGRFDFETNTSSPLTEISVADAKAADKGVEDLFQKRLFIRAPQQTVTNTATVKVMDGEPAPPPKLKPEIERVQALMAANKSGEALPILDKLMAEERDEKMLGFLGGLRTAALLGAGRMDDADAQVDRLLAHDPRNAYFLNMKGELLMMRQRPEDALIVLDRAILIDPQDANVYVARGVARAAAGKADQAIEDYRLAISLKPDHPTATVELVRTLTAAKRHDEALKAAEAWARVSPDNDVPYALMGNILSNMDKKKEAREALDRSLALEPNQNALLIYLSRQLDTTLQQDEAHALQWIRLLPGALVPGPAAERLAADPQARARVEAAFDESLAANPEKAARIKAARLALSQPATGSIALADLDLADRPNDAAALNNACYTRAAANVELPRALELCDKSLALVRGAPTLDSRAFVLLRMGRLDESIRDFDAALALQPGLANSLYGRGIARLRKGDKAAGQADLKAAAEIHPKIAETYADMGVKP